MLNNNNTENNEPAESPDENEIPDVVVERLHYDEPAKSPDEIHKAAMKGIETLWKSGQINVVFAIGLMNKANNVLRQSKQKLQDEKKDPIVYDRKFPCAVCKEEVTATKILNGYLIECGCVPAFSPGAGIEINSWYDRRD